MIIDGKRRWLNKRKFCLTCSPFNEFIQSGKHYPKLERVKCICVKCGVSFERLPSEIRFGDRIFCSRTCSASYNNTVYKSGENHPNWKGGKWYQPRALKEFGEVCSLCGETERCCLEVHHKDRNRDNNSLDNLIVLCANCHLKVHNNITVLL